METQLPAFKSFKDLVVWERSHELAILIYRLTESLPKHEIYGLTSQLRRAAVSTAANITEGSKRRSTNDLCHFLNMAEGSNEELKYLLLLGRDLGYVTFDLYSQSTQLADRISALLFNLKRSLQN